MLPTEDGVAGPDGLAPTAGALSSPAHSSAAAAAAPSSLPPPPRGEIPYVLLNMITGLTYPLFEGRNVVGRSPTPMHDMFFINLESPRSAISRVHSEILVAPNGDVWISDAKSTNGTHIAVREGQGITLEPERFYYCVSGTRMLFGDVELTLVIDDTILGESSAAAAASIPPIGVGANVGDSPASSVPVGQSAPYFPRILSPSPAGVVGPGTSLPQIPRTLSDLPAGFVTRARSRSTSRRSSSQTRSRTSRDDEDNRAAKAQFLFAGSADRMAAQVLNAASSGVSASVHPCSVPVDPAPSVTAESVVGVQPRASGQRSSTGSNRSLVPYLQDVDEEDPIQRSQIKPHSKKEPPTATRTKKAPVPRPKKQTLQPNGDDDCEAQPSKKARTEVSSGNDLLAGAAAPPLPISVCLSGFDSKEKEILTKLVKSRKGTVVDSMTAKGVDVLIVREPPTRTPKFLISMGRGRPIATSQFLEDAAPLSRALEYMPDLLHNGVRYTSKKMQQALRSVASHGEASKSGVLSGRSFYISDAVGSGKQVLVDVIRGCGGDISRKKGGDDVDLVTDADEVYRKLLTGEYAKP